MPTQPEVINNSIIALFDQPKIHKPNSILRGGQTKVHLRTQSPVNSRAITPHLDVGT